MNSPKEINPSHYRSHASGVECIEITEQMNFCLGNAFKYLFRCGQKGREDLDLQKALWYLRREIGNCKDRWWRRMLTADVDPFTAATEDVTKVLYSETRYFGHMASALARVWAAHRTAGTSRWLWLAVESVEAMLRIEKARNAPLKHCLRHGPEKDPYCVDCWRDSQP